MNKKYYIDFALLATYEKILVENSVAAQALKEAAINIIVCSEPEKSLAFESLKKIEIVKEVK